MNLMPLMLGLLTATIIIPLFLWIRGLIRDAKERREIKRLISQGKILQPLDVKDYDAEQWKGVINQDKNIEELGAFQERTKDLTKAINLDDKK